MNELISSLLTKAATIKDETTPDANTATRIGQMFQDIINLLSTKEPAKIQLQDTNLLASNLYVQNGTASTFMTATGIRFFPIVLNQDSTVKELSIVLSSTAASACSFALYNDDGAGYPAEINADFPETPIITTTTGIKTITPASAVTLAAGQYWVALYVDVTLNWRVTNTINQLTVMPQKLGSGVANPLQTNWLVAGTFSPLPDPAPGSMILQSYNNLVTWFTYA